MAEARAASKTRWTRKLGRKEVVAVNGAFAPVGFLPILKSRSKDLLRRNPTLVTPTYAANTFTTLKDSKDMNHMAVLAAHTTAAMLQQLGLAGQRGLATAVAEPGTAAINAVNKVSVQVPPFWSNDPDLWFAKVEAQFATANVTASSTKFNHVGVTNVGFLRRRSLDLDFRIGRNPTLFYSSVFQRKN
ncbi:Uncharacterized protein FKW44_014343 [Caligus rogercresseyi]|uniref:DUF7041 domain-containing protein n=1 Tax=Caligus rogercresseyi TaxID=217165 RepID=A0A7T8GYT0_CALRO|nr:Uncharacterized protein FKW44_014343 [Caligus rogercresseyi]